MEGSDDLDRALECFHIVPNTVEEQDKDHHLFADGKIYCWKVSDFEASKVFYRLLESRPSLSNWMGCNITSNYIATLCEHRRRVPQERVHAGQK